MFKKTVVLITLFLSISITYCQKIKYGKVSKTDLEEKFYDKDSTANAAYLGRYRKTFFEFNETSSSFEVVTEVHNRIKIYNKKGYNRATFLIRFYDPDSGSEEKVFDIKGITYALNKKGKINKYKLITDNIFKEKKNKYWSIMKVTMPNVTEGCIIDFKYKTKSPFFSNIKDLNFQFNIPVKYLDYTIEIPEYFKFNNLSKGYYNIEPEISQQTSFFTITNKSRSADAGFSVSRTSYDTQRFDYQVKVSNFKDENIPALKNDEIFISSYENYRGGVSYELAQTDFLNIGGSIKSYSRTWQEVTDQIYKSYNFGAELKKTGYFRNDLNRIISQSKNETEKLISIFSFVKNRVKWNNFISIYTNKGVRKAYMDRVGNVAEINLILTAMLKSAGFNAHPVLLSSRSYGTPLFPTIDGFNYVITVVDLQDGSQILLDATDEFSSLNNLPNRAINWKGRKVIKGGESSWIDLTSLNSSIEDNVMLLNLSKDLGIKGVLRTKFDNKRAMNYRKKNSSKAYDNIIEELEGRYNIEIEDFNINNLKDYFKPIIRNIKFNSDNMVERINNKIYLRPLLFLAHNWNPFKAKERKFPVDFINSWKKNNRVSIQIPEGFSVNKLPEPIAIGLPNGIGFFKYKAKQIGSIIKINSTLQFKSAVVPSEYYESLKQFYKTLIEKEAEKIILTKT